jgi:hypothetical protein
MHTAPLPAAALLLVLTLSPLQAQSGWGTEGGALMDGLDYSLITAEEGSSGQEQRWIEAVVLWRSPPRAPARGACPDTAALAAASRAYREARRSAEDRGRAFLGSQWGGVVRIVEYDPDAREVFALGQPFSLAGRDSALVVMVAEEAGGEQSLAGSAWVDSRLPDEAWSRHWVSGDTVFMVGPRNRDAHLLELLRRSPAVRGFIPQPDDTAPGDDGRRAYGCADEPRGARETP